MNKKTDLTKEEQDIENAIERGELVPMCGTDLEWITKITREAATNYLNAKKDARINIRLPSGDLERLKSRAASEGLPYQTMIAGILHKVAHGQWDERQG